MSSPDQDSIYRRATEALRGTAAARAPGGKPDWARVIEVLEGTPVPNDSDQIESALSSGLGVVIAEITQDLSRRDNVLPESGVKADEGTTAPLASLWQAVLPFTRTMGAADLASWVRGVLHVGPARGLTLLGVARAAKESGFNQTDFDWSDDTNALRDAVALEVAATITPGASAARVGDAFGLASVLGVPFDSVHWRQFAETAGMSRSTELLDCVWDAYEAAAKPLDSAAWKAFIVATTECGDEYLARRLWDTRQRHDSPISAAEWVRFAQAAGRFRDRELLGQIVRGLRASGTKLRPPGWHAFFEAACMTHSAVLDQVWEVWRGSDVPFSNSTMYSLAKVAETGRLGDLLEKVWSVCRDATNELSPRVWVGLTRAAKECDRPDLLREQWNAWRSSGTKLEPRGWGAFATAAGVTGQGDLVEEVWQTFQADSGEPDAGFLGAVANAAGLVKLQDLARNVWGACRSLSRELRGSDDSKNGVIPRPALGSRTWGSLAGAAGKCEDGELVSEIWHAYRESGERLNPEAWATFMLAAASTCQEALVADVWVGCKSSGSPLSSRSWTMAATAAGTICDGELVREMWSDWRAQRTQVELHALGAFARAAGRTRQADLIPEIWAECQGDENTPSPWTWNTCAIAAARTGSADLVRDLWSAWRTSGVEVDMRALGAFAAAAGGAQDGELLEEVWRTCVSTEVTLNSRAWASLARAAGNTNREDLLDEIWVAWAGSDTELESGAWTAFAVAASDVENHAVLYDIWKTWRARDLSSDDVVWARMAWAAQRAGHFGLLEDVVTACIGLEPAPPERTWGAIADSAGDAGRADLVEAIWRAYRQVRTSPGFETMGALAKAASVFSNSAFLTELFDAWQPGVDTLSRNEHLTWNCLLVSALDLGDEELFLKIFLRLESLYDPIRLPHRGSLQGQLWTMVRRIKSVAIRREVLDTLQFFRLDLDRCFHVLETVPPAESLGQNSGPFEGAGRCLMTWLVNKYFHADPTEFERSLTVLVDRLLDLAQHRTKAWHAMFCRGQGAYAGCLNGRAIDRIERIVSSLSAVSDEDLVKALERRDGPILERIRRFYLHEVDNIPTPQSAKQIPHDGDACQLEPLISFLVDSQAAFLRGEQKHTGSRFFELAWNLLVEARPDELSSADWIEGLHTLLDRMTVTVWDHVGRTIKDEVHAHKNELEILGQLAREAESVEDRQHLAKVTRDALGFFSSQQMGGFRVQKPIPININRHIEMFLLGGHPESRKLEIDIPKRLVRIGGWEGVFRRVLRPLMREIRANADQALSQLPLDEQVFGVRLSQGSGSDAGFAVLEVWNTFEPQPSADRFSTRRGQRTIQMLAMFLRREFRRGFAWSKTSVDDMGRPLHTWSVFMPLWDAGEPERSYAAV